MLIYRSNAAHNAPAAPRAEAPAATRRGRAPRRSWSAAEIAAVIDAPVRGRTLARTLGREPSSLRALVEKLRLEGRL